MAEQNKHKQNELDELEQTIAALQSTISQREDQIKILEQKNVDLRHQVGAVAANVDERQGSEMTNTTKIMVEEFQKQLDEKDRQLDSQKAQILSM